MTSGLSFRSALKNAVWLQVGMFGAKACSKLFGAGSSETDPATWGWRSYLQGGLGGVGISMVINAMKPGSGQKILEGTLAFIGYKILQNELIAGNETATNWFGADDDLELDGYGADDVLELDGDGNPYMVDGDGTVIPLDETYRMGLGAAPWAIRRGRRMPPRGGFRRRRPPRMFPGGPGPRPMRRPHRPGFGPPPPMGRQGRRMLPQPRRRFYGDDEIDLPEVSGIGEVEVPVGPLGDALAPPSELGLYGEGYELEGPREELLADYRSAWGL